MKKALHDVVQSRAESSQHSSKPYEICRKLLANLHGKLFKEHGPSEQIHGFLHQNHVKFAIPSGADMKPAETQKVWHSFAFWV